MAISFPSNPTTNQTYTYNDKLWTFDGERWLTTGTSSTSSTPIVPISVSDTVPGSTIEGSIWVDKTTGTLSVYVGGAWVLASAGVLNVAANTLPGNSIVDSSITTTQLADGAITYTKLAADAAVPAQTGQSGKYLTTNGSTASWGTVSTVSNTSIRAQAMTMGIIFGG